MTLGNYANTIFKDRYALTPSETWEGCAKRQAKFVANGDAKLEKLFEHIISERLFIPGGRYLYGVGRKIPQISSCFLLRVEDSREGWGQLLHKHIMALSLGGGVGTEYSRVRAKGLPIGGYGGVASGPVSLMNIVNESARHIRAGASRRAALWAGMVWSHPDIEEFINAKNWSTQIRALKEQDPDFPAPLDVTNISVRLDDAFFKAVKTDKSVQKLYYDICKNMCKTGEPGFSVNVGDQSDYILRNPCAEVVSDTDSDCCNLGAINLGRIKDLDQLEYVVRYATRFLYNGTEVGAMPHPDFAAVRSKNRRIGLGLMGLHEWCLKQGQRYETSGKLGRWLSVYQGVSDEEAEEYSAELGKPRPAGVRAIAPNGTIGLIGETTTSIEAIYSVAYKRRFARNGSWSYQYVIDPTAERLITKEGMDPNEIEDSFSLAQDVERRISMQAFVQDFVDQSISSTINMPEYGEKGNNNIKRFSEKLLRYLPRLRGITVYPDGARAHQPITPIKYETAKKYGNVVYEENEERCSGGVCGI